MVGMIAAALNVQPRIAAAPKAALWLASWLDPVIGAVLEMTYQFESPFVMDHSAFSAQFGMSPTPLPQAIDATVAWYRTHAAQAREV